MIDVDDQFDFNAVLVGAGFVTVSKPVYFTFKATPTDNDIHYTQDKQIYGKDGLTLYIKNPFPTSDELQYAVEP